MEQKVLCRFGATYSFRSLLLNIDWWTRAFPCFDADYMRAVGREGWREAVNVSKTLFFSYRTVGFPEYKCFPKGYFAGFLLQGCTDPVHQAAVCYTVAPDFCGPSVWTQLRDL